MAAADSSSGTTQDDDDNNDDSELLKVTVRIPLHSSESLSSSLYQLLPSTTTGSQQQHRQRVDGREGENRRYSKSGLASAFCIAKQPVIDEHDKEKTFKSILGGNDDNNDVLIDVGKDEYGCDMNDRIMTGGTLTIQCHRDGTAWGGLYPVLYESPSNIAKKAVLILLNSFRRYIVFKNFSAESFGQILDPNDTTDTHGRTKKINNLGQEEEGVTFRSSDRDESHEERQQYDNFTEGNTSLECNQEGSAADADSHTDSSCRLVTSSPPWIERTITIHKSDYYQINTNSLIDLSTRRVFLSRKRKRRVKSSDSGEGSSLRQILLIVLPTQPPLIPSLPNLRPERTFTSKLVQLENLQIKLQTLNAFIATLGGGYFLCRHLSMAIALARSQRSVALAMGDVNLAGRCTVNEAYNYIHDGWIDYALWLIRRELEEARKRGDALTIQMCKSARLFAKRVRRAALYEDNIISSGDSVTIEAKDNSGDVKQTRHRGQKGASKNTGTGSGGTVAEEKTKVGEELSPVERSGDVAGSVALQGRRCDSTGSVPPPTSATCDDFQRIRIVRDRTRVKQQRI